MAIFPLIPLFTLNKIGDKLAVQKLLLVRFKNKNVLFSKKDEVEEYWIVAKTK